MLPRADQHGEAGQRAELHRAVAMMLGTDQRPQQRRNRRRVLACESLDVRGRQADDIRDAVGRVVLDAIDQRVVADGVLRDVVAIDEPVADDHVHHRERQRPVAARLELHVPVGGLRGARPDRIDHDHLRATPLRLVHERPEVQVGDDRVRAPEHDVAAVHDVLGIDPRAGADGRGQARRGDGAADLAMEAAAPHRPEQPLVDRRRLNQPLRARGAVREDRFRSRFSNDRLPARRDVRQRGLPRHALEAPLALRADPLERMQHAIRVIDALQVVIHLGAERAAREGVRGIAGQRHSGAVAHVHGPRAGVGAIVAAGATHDLD